MSHCVVWIEHDHAKIFKYSPQTSTKIEIKNKHLGNHHTGHYEQEQRNNLKKYYHEVAENLKEAQKILLVGPGMAKSEFRKHLEAHDHIHLSKNVIGVETMDKSTEGEIKNWQNGFFNSIIFSIRNFSKFGGRNEVKISWCCPDCYRKPHSIFASRFRWRC